MNSSEVELEELACRLRTRIAERHYRDAQEALQEYCRALRKTAACLPPDDAGLRRLEEEWLRLLDETRRRVLAGRAHTGARLARLPKPITAYNQPSHPRHTWQYSG